MAMDAFYRFHVGPYACIALSDGGYAGHDGMLFASAPAPELRSALADRGETPDSLPSSWTCLLVETGSETVLIDTGGGASSEPYGGRLPAALEAAGRPATAVDTVVITHAHGDHIGGCLDADGNVAFPNARFVLSQAEKAFWQSAASLSVASERSVTRVRHILATLAERVTVIAGAAQIAPGVRAVPAPGHTAGHMAVEIGAGDAGLIFLADTALHPLHIPHPQWTGSVDMFPEQAVQTRLALYERAMESGYPVLAFHFLPFPGLGRICRDGDGWAWRPL